MRKYSFLIAALFIFQSLYAQKDPEMMKQELIKADSAFSVMSKEKGRNAAFIANVADDGVMLRPNGYPLRGKSVITETLTKRPDTSYTLTWKPLFADIAESGELGYTYGTFELAAKDANGNKLNQEGTYATIWKKDKNGNWKFVLDMGNEGLKPKQ